VTQPTALTAASGRYLTLHVTFLTRTYGGEEWPPSPARLVQAIAAGNEGTTAPGLAWIERQAAPFILATDPPEVVTRRDYVPLNATPDHATRNARDRLIRREVQPVGYVWPLADDEDERGALAVLGCAGRVSSLGSGQDMAVVRGWISQAAPQSGAAVRLWQPVVAGGRMDVDALLLTPAPGMMVELTRRHAMTVAGVSVLKTAGHWSPQGGQATSDGTGFALVAYRPSDAAPRSALAAYGLERLDGSGASWPAGAAAQVSGMVRHALIGLTGDDVALGEFVSGHPSADRGCRVSIVPVPSTGHEHADGRLRRVLLTARPVDAAWLARLLARVPRTGLSMIDEETGEVVARAVTIAGVRGEPVIRQLLRPSRTWASVQPVILPGRDSGDPRRTRKLVMRALAHAGVDTGLVAQIDIGKHGFLRQSVAYGDTHIKACDSWAFPAVHVRIHFDRPIAGPLVLGQGRNAGVGALAPCANPE
jgi:CRISPR-associated protein Csb2